MKIRNPSDFGAGVLVASIALAFLLAGRILPLGTPSEMGPGWFPMHVAILALATGTWLIIRSLLKKGSPLPPFRPRPLLAVAAAVLAFSFGINPLGFMIAAPLTILIASAAVQGTELRSRLIIALAVTLLAAAIFVGALGLNIPLWPGQ